MVAGVLKEEEVGEEMVLATGKAHLEDVWGWGGTRGSGVVNDGFPPKREEGLLRERSCGVGL